MDDRETHPLGSDGVRDAVQAFYDLHPYPPPVEDLDSYRRRWQDENRRRADFHLHWPDRAYRPDLKVLVAGCGTSQAAKHALRQPACSGRRHRYQPDQPAPHRSAQAQLSPGQPRGVSVARRAGWRAGPSLRQDRVHRCAAPPAGPGAGSARLAGGAGAWRRNAPDGLRRLRPGRRIHAAGILPPAWASAIPTRKSRTWLSR